MIDIPGWFLAVGYVGQVRDAGESAGFLELDGSPEGVGDTGAPDSAQGARFGCDSHRQR